MARHQDPLRSIGHGFAHAEDAAVVGWDEPVALGKDGGDSQAGDPCRSRQSSCNQLSSGEYVAHKGSFLATLWPADHGPHAPREARETDHGDVHEKKENKEIRDEKVACARGLLTMEGSHEDGEDRGDRG